MTDVREVEGLVVHVGTKMLGAKLMNRADYNSFQGWDMPEDENGEDEGYLVQYSTGYISWSPKKEFEDTYRRTDNMTFGIAVEMMKAGYRVARAGWNGKGMFVIYVPGAKSMTFQNGTPYARALNFLADPSGNVHEQEILPHFDMYTVNAEGDRAMLPGWLASQSDISSEDWCIVTD